jgi:hypothetical protein
MHIQYSLKHLIPHVFFLIDTSLEWRDLNPGPVLQQTRALPTELRCNLSEVGKGQPSICPCSMAYRVCETGTIQYVGIFPVIQHVVLLARSRQGQQT